MKKTRSVLTRLVPLVAALVLAGCASVQTVEPAAAPAAPAAFKELDGRWTQAQPAEAQARGEWWKVFSDPALDDLVVRADRNSTSVQLAAARLNQARALLRAADADRLPQVGVAAGASRGNTATPGVTNPSTLLTAGASVAWEADVFGRLAKASQAAALDAQASEALLQSTRLLVQSDVARAYFTLRALDSERALVRQTSKPLKE